MERTSVDDYIAKARTRLERLYRTTPLTPEAREHLLTESMEQLADTLEELQVASEELRERNRLLALAHLHYRELFDFAPGAYLVTDANGVVQETNQAASHLLRRPIQRLQGKPLVLYVAKQDRRAFRARLAQLGGAEGIQELDLVLQPHAAPAFSAALTVTHLPGARGQPAALRWLVRDITARQRAQECLRGLAREMMRVQEEERQHVSRMLYDEVAQSLAAINMRLQSLPERAREGNAIGAISSQLGATLTQLETLARDLRPPALDVLGLDATLHEYCREWGERTQYAVDYRGARLSELPDTVSTLLYRLLQETLSNVARHAHARHVRVSLKEEAGSVRLAVEDDGNGFDPHTLSRGDPCEEGPSREEKLASGALFRMRERIELLGGQLETISQPGRGTRVVAILPRVV